MDVVRFWAKVDRRGPDDCWVWKGAVHVGKGYGAFYVSDNQRQHGSHIISWELTHGPVPAGLCVCHSCDVRYPVGDITYRRCCNPAHLWLGTNAQNSADMVAKGRQATGERLRLERRARGDRNGSRVHPEKLCRGEEHKNAKLTESTVPRIFEMAGNGFSKSAIAREFGVSRKLVRLVLQRRIWRHVPIDGMVTLSLPEAAS